MARPYSFDPNSALEIAMNVFWRDGYDLASISQLQNAMGINRGSLYQEFGSKQKLFLKSFNLYVERFVDPGIKLLSSSDMPGRDRIKHFFDMVPADARGCLLCNSAAGAAGTDNDIRVAVSTQLERLRVAFGDALKDDLPDTNERRSEAERLTQLYIGKRIETRTLV